MVRWFVTCIALCALAFGAVFVLTDPLHLIAGTATNGGDAAPPKNGNNPQLANVAPEVAGKEVAKVNIVFDPDNAQTARLSPTVITGGTIVAINKQEVPSEREGRILFIARELKPGELKDHPQIDSADKSSDKYFSEMLSYIAIDTSPQTSTRPGETSPPPLPDQLKRWMLGQPLEAGRVIVASEKRYFRKLEVGDKVHTGDILAVVNPILALDELDIKKEKLRVAMAEVETSRATKEEALQRWNSMLEAVKTVKRAYSDEDIRGAKLTYERYVQEEIAKRAAYVQAQRELNASITQLKMHEIPAQITGVVKTIYKSRGDAVKALDPVLQLQDLEHLRVEGVMEIQYANKVNVGDTVLIEPAIADSPRMVLTGHLQDVNCVAVSKGEKPLILSGSEDRTLRVWNAATGEQTVKIEHKAAVRSVACTGKNAEANLALVGCSDGSARLFNLDNKVSLAKELPRQHKSSVTCVAFSPNGKVCATGGDDHAICLYDTASGELLDKRTDAHKSLVTSVQFATDDTFVSAGGDHVLNVWKFSKGLAPVVLHQFDKRSGDVTQLGVSPDGQYVLFDDGKDLRILSLQSGQIVGSIQNSEGAGFRGLAVFAPDGKTILTTSASENRLQLWRTPALGKEVADDTMGRRAAELRQFTWSTGKENSAAYAPDAAFLVTGTQDNQVLVWAMPDKKQIEEKVTARVSLVEKSLDASSRQVRIWAEVDNKSGWLVPGGTATIVIPPKK